MDLKEISVSMRKWIDTAQDREYWKILTNVTLNLLVVLAVVVISVIILVIVIVRVVIIVVS